MEDIFAKLYDMTAFSNIIADPSFLVMYAIAFILLYLGIKKHYEPLLLVRTCHRDSMHRDLCTCNARVHLPLSVPKLLSYRMQHLSYSFGADHSLYLVPSSAAV